MKIGNFLFEFPRSLVVYVEMHRHAKPWIIGATGAMIDELVGDDVAECQYAYVDNSSNEYSLHDWINQIGPRFNQYTSLNFAIEPY